MVMGGAWVGGGQVWVYLLGMYYSLLLDLFC